MNVTKWNPFGELEEIADRYGRLFGTHLPMRERLELLGKDIEWKPAADIVERDDEYLIKAELPGVERDAIDIHLENDVLTITGERKLEETKDTDKTHRVERFYGRFSRSFRVPDDVDASAIKAESKDGVLRLHLPKTEAKQSQAVKIAIR
ncbi:MAG: Hsp20/alpha crystallin family protein [Gammaproteobacteria bacterium]|nr:Hsp20/alpha crystallin family protein [Gammaproteobacteria bacterium]MDH3507693.1 Hsp20/alpha crystallin family protein [Gammaproteobacteria bacterium]